jgi:hypothetical protein
LLAAFTWQLPGCTLDRPLQRESALAELSCLPKQAKGDQVMTEAELWEMFFEALSVTTSLFSVELTVNFAYLATAYFVGRRLSAFQTLVVSFLYVFGAGILIPAFVGAGSP